MARECYPGDLTEVRDDIEYAGRTPRLFDQLCYVQGREWRLLGRRFSTSVEPAASAGASFQAAIIVGAFHGVMAPMTPTGSRIVSIPALTLERRQA
jgi:hypothetical protein